MKIIDYIHVMAGGSVLISIGLATYVNKYWIFLALFTALNLFQFGFTKFCPVAILLKKIGVKE